MSMNTEIAFDKIQYSFMIKTLSNHNKKTKNKTLNKLKVQGNFLILVKSTYKKKVIKNNKTDNKAMVVLNTPISFLRLFPNEVPYSLT